MLPGSGCSSVLLIRLSHPWTAVVGIHTPASCSTVITMVMAPTEDLPSSTSPSEIEAVQAGQSWKVSRKLSLELFYIPSPSVTVL